MNLHGMDSSGSVQGQAAGSCEQGHDTFGSIKGGERLDFVRDHLRNKFSVPRCKLASWFGLVWFGLVWFGLVWSGLVWVEFGWSGLVWSGLG
jgi:hypothetical protein